MNNGKIDVESAAKQYNSLDTGCKGIAIALLQLMSTLFLNIYQAQNINNQQKNQQKKDA